MNPDLEVNDQGTILLLISRSDEGDEWIKEHIDPEALRLGTAVVVEHRYIEDIVLGAREDGLVVA